MKHTPHTRLFVLSALFAASSIGLLQQVSPGSQSQDLGARVLPGGFVLVSGHLVFQQAASSSQSSASAMLSYVQMRRLARLAEQHASSSAGRAPTAFGAFHAQTRSRASVAPFVLGSNTQSSAGAVKAYCGDGLVTGTEYCDDGNNVNNDGCDSTCHIEPGFTCYGQPSVCHSRCGDGVRATNEECDDGNESNGDGCSSNCKVELTWACTGDVGSLSSCGPAPVCGDGIVQTGEDCDDGNNHDGDGCSHNCRQEPGYTCTGSPSICTKS